MAKLEQFLADHLLLMGAVGIGVACLQVSEAGDDLPQLSFHTPVSGKGAGACTYMRVWPCPALPHLPWQPRMNHILAVPREP